jgi:putative flippase GtrA
MEILEHKQPMQIRSDHKNAEAEVKSELTVQTVRFGIVGILNTLLDILLFYFLSRYTALADSLLIAKAASFAAGTLNSYFWNSRWTFKEVMQWRRFFKFAAVAFVTLGINIFVFQLATQITRFNLLGVLLAAVASFGCGFILNKFWTFQTDALKA